MVITGSSHDGRDGVSGGD